MFTQSLSYIKNDNTRLLNDIVIMSTWIQTRVSTKDQVGKRIGGFFQEKASLQEQETKCKEAILHYKNRCPKCGKEIRLEFLGISTAKGESGQNLEREDTNKFLALAKDNRFQVLVTNDSDRLARATGTGAYIRQELNRRGIQIYSLSQPMTLKCFNCFDYYDDDTGAMIGMFSDMNSRLAISKIRRNYEIGMPKRIESGKPTGSLAYGLMKKYKITGKDLAGNDTLETEYVWDPIKVSIINRIVKDYLNCIGLWKICQNLNREGIPSAQGKKWGRSAILVILKNPAYAGFIRWGWKPVKNGVRKIQPREKWLICKAQYKAIWENDFYERLQEEIKRRAKVGGRTVSSNALLIGLLKCGHCSHSMYQTSTRRIFKNGTKYLFKGYSCGSFMHFAYCQSNGKKQEIVDTLVLQEVMRLANEKTRQAFLEKINKTKINSQEEFYIQKEKEYKQVQFKLNRITEAYRSGIDTLGEYKRNKEEFIPILETIEKEILKLKKHKNIPIKIEWEKEYNSILSKFVTQPTKEDKKIIRRILFRLIDKIEFKKDPLYIKIYYKTNSETH